MAGRHPSALPHRTGVLLRKPRSGGSWRGLQPAVVTPAENTAVCVQRAKWVMSSLPQVWDALRQQDKSPPGALGSECPGWGLARGLPGSSWRERSNKTTFTLTPVASLWSLRPPWSSVIP